MGKGGESWIERAEVGETENMTCQYEKGPVSPQIRPFGSTIRSTCTSDGGRRWPPSSRPPQPHPGTHPQTFGVLELDAIVDGISGPLGGVVRAELVVARVGHVSGAGRYGVLQTLPTDTDDAGPVLKRPFDFSSVSENDVLRNCSLCLLPAGAAVGNPKTKLTLSEGSKT